MAKIKSELINFNDFPISSPLPTQFTSTNQVEIQLIIKTISIEKR